VGILMRRRDFRTLAALSLAFALEAHVAQAGSQRPIIGQWCGVDDYVINVAADDVFFHPRRGFYSPPAFNVSVGQDSASYSQRYESMQVTVSCTLVITGKQAATETCDNPEDSFYPKQGETAELHRCMPKIEPSV
jgi:hypothetical protein